MSIKVGVINYGNTGNIFNIINSIERAGGKSGLIKSATDFTNYDKLVLPGVGSFPNAMKKICDNGLKEILIDNIKRKPTLGICLGMQLMCKVGFEFEETYGLNLIDGEVRRIECKGKVPHMGFGRIEIVNDSPLFKGLKSDDKFYFMHSYEVINYTDISSLTTYFGHRFVSTYQKDNIFGVQFHPEKSREAGITIIRNFLEV